MRAAIQRFRRKAPGYPPPEFCGHTQRAGRRSLSPPHGRDWSPPTPRALAVGCLSPSGPRARSWRRGSACTAQPNSPRPRTAPGHLGAARHGRPPSPARPALPPRTVRTAGGERDTAAPRPAPAGTVAPARCARTLPVQLRLRPPPRSLHPSGRCTGGFEGTATPQTKPAAAMPGGLSFTRGRRARAPGPRLRLHAFYRRIAPLVQWLDVRTILFSRPRSAGSRS